MGCAMSKVISQPHYLNSLLMGLLGASAVAAWQLLPDRFMGPYSAWNPHAIMEFVIAIFSLSLFGNLAVHFLGPSYGLPLAGLVGGFASSTATIHTMGLSAKSQPHFADRAALGGVLSNLATLVQLCVLIQLLAPNLMASFVLPVCFGMTVMLLYTAWVITSTQSFPNTTGEAQEALSFKWQRLLTLTAIVCGVSFVSAALNEAYGQGGLFLGAAFSGLVDAHAMVPSVASLLARQKLMPNDALIAILIALTANTMTKSLVAFQSGGYVYARKVSGGVWATTAAVWLGYCVG
jgi:uncharacterized membrane protein (DUF4010 family)